MFVRGEEGASNVLRKEDFEGVGVGTSSSIPKGSGCFVRGRSARWLVEFMVILLVVGGLE